MQNKKLLGSTLALAMVLPFGQANASELFKGLTFGGQIDLQATAAQNVTDFRTRAGTTNGNDRIGDAQTRVLLNAGWTILDDVSAMVTLRKNDRTWGTAGGTAQAAPSNSQAVDAAGILGNVFVDQAYFKIAKLAGAVDATFGRQFYGESGDAVVYFGPSDKALYGLPVQALDAARFDWSNDMLGVTGIVAKVTGHALGVAGATQDVDLRGINVMLKGNDSLSGGAYLYNRLQHATGASGAAATGAGAGAFAASGRNDRLYVVGAKAKAMLGQAAWVGGEIAKNFGDNRLQNVTNFASRYTGWMAKVDAGMKAELAGLGAVAPWVHLGYGTGQGDLNSNQNNAFTAINGDYRPGTIMGRFSVLGAEQLGGAIGAFGANGVSNNTLSNRKIWGAGVKVTPGMMSKLTAGLAFWDFNTQTAASPVAPGGSAAFAGNRHIGSEVDLDLSWKHSDNVMIGAGVAQFQPGGLVKEAIQPAAGPATGNGNNPAQLAYFDVRVKWGGQ